MEKYISFSGGVESSAMCILYGKGAKAIFCDTGAEPKEIYERIKFCEKRLKEIHNDDFELIIIKADVNVKGQKVDSLIEYIKLYKYFPSMMQRFCTREFKIKPIDNFLKLLNECELMIGFNADEEPGKDRTGSFMKNKNVKYTYPLYDSGIDRSDCEALLLHHGMELNFPSYMNRGGCYMCFYKGLSELKAFYFFDKETFNQIKDLEEFIQDKRKRKYTAMLAVGKTMQQIQNECEQELQMWGEDAIRNMYGNVKQHQACGAFCHR